MKRIVTLLLTLFVLVTGVLAQLPEDLVTATKIFGNIDYTGNVGQAANAIAVTGTKEAPAQVVFLHNRRVTVRVLSQRFLVNENSVMSRQAAMCIYLYDTIHNTIDSIYHNDLGFRYNNDKHLVLLYRKDNGVGYGPFHDTYHDYDIFLEAIYWERGSDEMEFRRLEGPNTESEGVLASVSYFRKSDYLKIQALDRKHPMENLAEFVRLFADDDNRFNIIDYASYIKYPMPQVVSLILNLQAEGYLEYDRDTKMVTVLPRFFDVLASDRNEFDFDVIKFQTKVGNRQPNINLVLSTNDMVVYGIRDYQSKSNVPSITLSDFKHVLILPDNAKIVLKKDRNFNFSGCIMAGMYEFFTKESLFNYNDFSIEMTKVDSLRLFARFDGKVQPVKGIVERLTGTLEIDANDNKSSVRETPEYPKFSTTGNAYCFYRTINGGVFDLELPLDTLTDEDLAGKFYYCLDPFTVEQLDDLNSEDVMFRGRLVSGGIFPDIEAPLVLMDDRSLGFRHVIGDGVSESLPMYGGKGGFHQEVTLSNQGFFGQGRLDVATASFDAPHFDFYPDSVMAAVESFTMQEYADGVGFPKASCGPLDLRWDLTETQLYTATQDEPICLYDSTFFHGTTVLSEEGYRGEGVLTFGLTRFDAPLFEFDSRSFVADSSNFTLYDEDGQTQAFLADNYRATVNLDQKRVRFGYLDENSNLDFPLNQFYCSLNQAEWDMDANNIHLSGQPSEFISLLPEHDSLSFLSTHADYDMNNYTIRAHGVPSVTVADVEIVPWDHTVEIQRNAAISPLEHATIVADTAFRAHLYKDAAVSIYSRHDYIALGYKDYLDSEGVATPVFYDVINPVDGVTLAHAEIPDSLNFMLSPYFGFQGEVTSTASEPFDTYEGFFRIEQSCLEDTVWFVSTAVIDPSAVSIPIDMDAIKKIRPGLFNGLCYEFGSGGGYRVNFMKPMNPETVNVTAQNGELSYDVEHHSYVVSDEQHTLTMTDRCVVTMQGTSDLGFDSGLTQFACFGDYVGFPNDSVTMEGLCVFNTPVFDDQVLTDIAGVYAAVESDAIDLTQTQYVAYLKEERGEEAAEAMQREMELMPYPAIGAEDFYRHTIVIPSLKMVWNPSLRAFVSVGKIGLGSLGSHVVNRYVDGHVVFDRRLGVITFFFENDLFMTYLSYNCGNGQLQVHATYGTVNARLSDLGERSRSAKSDNLSFDYVVTPYEALTEFLTRLKRAGLR